MDFAKFFALPKYRGIALLYLVNSFVTNSLLPNLILLIGPSGSGKDTVLAALLSSGVCKHVMTATSRRRRYTFKDGISQEVKSETETQLNSCRDLETYQRRLDEFSDAGIIDVESDSYLWMRFRRADELTEEAYHQALIREYELIESDSHHGNLYGLPLSSIRKAVSATTGVSGSQAPVIRTEMKGVDTIRQKLAGQFNIIVVGILPDSWDVVRAKVYERVELSGKKDENPEMRLEESRRWVEQYEEKVNLVLHNSFEEGGLEKAVDSMKQLIASL